MIKHCGCKAGPNGVKFAAEYQDSAYGVGRRVHTVGGGKDTKKYRCSVCGKESSNTEVTKKK